MDQEEDPDIYNLKKCILGPENPDKRIRDLLLGGSEGGNVESHKEKRQRTGEAGTNATSEQTVDSLSSAPEDHAGALSRGSGKDCSEKDGLNRGDFAQSDKDCSQKDCATRRDFAQSEKDCSDKDGVEREDFAQSEKDCSDKDGVEREDFAQSEKGPSGKDDEKQVRQRVKLTITKDVGARQDVNKAGIKENCRRGRAREDVKSDADVKDNGKLEGDKNGQLGCEQTDGVVGEQPED